VFTKQTETPKPTDIGISVSGINHNSAKIELREQLALDQEQTSLALSRLKAFPIINEAVLVSTCNRVEVVTAGKIYNGNSGDVASHVRSTLGDLSGVEAEDLNDAFYHYDGTSAVGHVFRVAAGLDSLVVGEPQILGQLKTAYRTALDCGATSTLLNRLFPRAFGVAKAVRSQTNIGKNAVSISYAAKELAKHIFGDLTKSSVLLIGAGDIGTLALKNFASANVKRMYIANRTIETASSLAQEFGAVALSLEQIPSVLSEVDIVIGACTLPTEANALLSKVEVLWATAERPGKAQFYIDLACPRNFSEDIAELDDAFVYNIDNLKDVVDRNFESRQLEVDRAKLIVDDEVNKFSKWLEQKECEPTIKELMANCEAYKSLEIRKTIKRLAREGHDLDRSQELEEALDSFANALIAKVLHNPLESLKDEVGRDAYFESVFREMFCTKRKR
jgi:glutamyl-tRNA reductase